MQKIIVRNNTGTVNIYYNYGNYEKGGVMPEQTIKSMKEAIDTVYKASERLFFMTRATGHPEFDKNDAQVLEDYLCDISTDLLGVRDFLKTQEAPATKPESEETGA